MRLSLGIGMKFSVTQFLYFLWILGYLGGSSMLEILLDFFVTNRGQSCIYLLFLKILDSLFDRFERYFLSEYTDVEFRAIAVKRPKQEGIENDELALYIADSVLSLNRKSLKDVIRIARKSRTHPRCR
ncbi:MAG: hypothetical protein M3Y53_01330 [Thermoproteota archaeon]|nr:hypothetical protein [Thermoproteota archaeon]